MSEIRVTDPQTGGMKNSKLEQLSLVDPGFKAWAIEEWSPPDEPRARVALNLVDFEEGRNAAIYPLLLAAQDLLVQACGGGRTKAVVELARQYGFGSRKYDRGNWRKGYAWSLSIDALWRHLLFPFSVDEESGNLHAAAVLWHACCLRDFVQLGLGTDDRLYKTLEVEPVATTDAMNIFYDEYELAKRRTAEALAVPDFILTDCESCPDRETCPDAELW